MIKFITIFLHLTTTFTERCEDAILGVSYDFTTMKLHILLRTYKNLRL